MRNNDKKKVKKLRIFWAVVRTDDETKEYRGQLFGTRKRARASVKMWKDYSLISYKIIKIQEVLR